MLVTLLSVVLLSNFVYIFDKIDLEGNTEYNQDIYTKYFKLDSLNAFTYMYKLLLGQIDVDEFSERDDLIKVILWVIFFAATFLL